MTGERGAQRRARIGVVGAGAVARRHVATLSGFPDARVTAVADVDALRAASLAESCLAASYASCDAMLGAEELDAVYVCVPPFAHGPPELAVIEAGLPLFVEKPIAIDLPMAETIAAAVHARGILTAVGYHWRHLDTVVHARELVRSHPARLVVGAWLDKIPDVAWWSIRARSGGQIVEQATHVLDLLRFVAGEVSEVHARSPAERETTPSRDIATATAATLTLESGAVGTVIASCLLPGRHRAGLDIFCEGMALELSETDLVVTRSGQGPVRRAASVNARIEVDRAFVDAVNGLENRIPAPYEEALETQRLACAIADAADDARPPTSLRRSRERDTARSLGIAQPGHAAMFDVRLPPPTDGQFSVRTLYTGLSAGTELTFLMGTNPALHAGWDADLGVFGDERPARSYPIRTLGYMEVGEVTTSAETVGLGQRVAMAYGHKTAHTADPLRDRFVALPDDLDPLLGIYVAHMGPICANGLLHAAADLVGTNVRTLGDGVHGRELLVMGAGVVGLLTALFAVHHGARSVMIADGRPHRVRAARRLGLDVIDLEAQSAWRVVKQRHRHGPGDRGADVAFQCRASGDSLGEALRSLRPQGTVIDLAFYTDGASSLRLGHEFHHNGLAIRAAQIARVPRGLGPSWDRDRLSAETIDLLRARGADIRSEVVTDVVPLEGAPRMLEDLLARRREVIQAVFEVASSSTGGPAARRRTSA
jgi:predicted dehydrogenase/NADPH:quinone reductase-like Zn-dependent oxidoreductase